MPWYAWLILIVAIGSIVGGLMMLRDTANKVELTDEQRKRVAERNAEMDAKGGQGSLICLCGEGACSRWVCRSCRVQRGCDLSPIN